MATYINHKPGDSTEGQYFVNTPSIRLLALRMVARPTLRDQWHSLKGLVEAIPACLASRQLHAVVDKGVSSYDNIHLQSGAIVAHISLECSI